MDAVGFVLILVGLAMLAEQVLTILGGIFVYTALNSGVREAKCNWTFGRVGVLLAVVGGCLMYFL